MTRGSITGQVKAISMIVAMQNFIPDRRAFSSEQKSAPAPAQQANSPARPAPPGPSQSAAYRFTPSEAPKSHVPMYGSVPDLGVSFPIKKTPLNPFVHPR